MKYSRKGHKTEIDTRTKYKGVGKMGWFMSDINRIQTKTSTDNKQCYQTNRSSQMGAP